MKTTEMKLVLFFARGPLDLLFFHYDIQSDFDLVEGDYVYFKLGKDNFNNDRAILSDVWDRSSERYKFTGQKNVLGYYVCKYAPNP